MCVILMCFNKDVCLKKVSKTFQTSGGGSPAVPFSIDVGKTAGQVKQVTGCQVSSRGLREAEGFNNIRSGSKNTSINCKLSSAQQRGR